MSPRRAGRPSAIAALGLTGAPAAPAAVGESQQALPEVPAPPADPPAPTPSPDEPVRQYTLRLTERAANGADDLVLGIRRELGWRIERADLMRTLLYLAHNRANVREAVVRELRKQGPPAPPPGRSRR